MDLTYHEVTYKIYRETFKPHILMYPLPDMKGKNGWKC